MVTRFNPTFLESFVKQLSEAAACRNDASFEQCREHLMCLIDSESTLTEHDKAALRILMALNLDLISDLNDSTAVLDSTILMLRNFIQTNLSGEQYRVEYSKLMEILQIYRPSIIVTPAFQTVNTGISQSVNPIRDITGLKAVPTELSKAQFATSPVRAARSKPKNISNNSLPPISVSQSSPSSSEQSYERYKSENIEPCLAVPPTPLIQSSGLLSKITRENSDASASIEPVTVCDSDATLSREIISCKPRNPQAVCPVIHDNYKKVASQIDDARLNYLIALDKVIADITNVTSK